MKLLRMKKAGMDAIVAQGSEAGGHRGSFLKPKNQLPMVGTISLVPQIVDVDSFGHCRWWNYGR